MSSIIGILGICLYASPLGSLLETKYGLDWLFKARGAISPPSNVVIVSIDKPSAQQLNIDISTKEWPRNISKWPRDLHAQLIKNLSEAGASLVVFDVIFNTPSDQLVNDEKLASAMKEFNNVFLIHRLDRNDCENAPSKLLRKNVRIVEECANALLPQFAAAAKASTPFLLARTRQTRDYWIFKESSGDAPTAPTILLQALALPLHNDFVRLISEADPSLKENSFLNTNPIALPLHDLALDFRNLFIKNKQLTENTQHELHKNSLLNIVQKQRIQTLLNIYSGESRRYLNFYGPPRSIQTIPYYQALQATKNTDPDKLFNKFDFQGKIVFVGFSAATYNEQDIGRDDYYTVFSDPNGFNTSGVEIIATAFANLYENKSIQSFHYTANFAILFIYGFMISMTLLLSRHRVSFVNKIIATAIVISVYWLYAYSLFKVTATWLPLLTPLLQTAIALIAILFFKLFDSQQRAREFELQLKTIRNFFGSTFPNSALEKAIGNNQDEQGIYGCCLNTDIESYTTIAEPLEPKLLRERLNEYHGLLKAPIVSQNGHVMDMHGDSMLAVWIANTNDDTQARIKACQASLDIAMAIEQFNHQSHEHMASMPTRFGLHFGEMSLRREQGSYNVVGDVVNTSNRIQDSNKLFKTRILISGEINKGLDGFLIRPLGLNYLRGRMHPIGLYELINYKHLATSDQLLLCEIFKEAFMHYESQNWSLAKQYFSETLKAFPHDGPAQYFIKNCQTQLSSKG
ncbi:CHASE2 domain-containing protein [Nitrosomonas sp. PY1]|uniref:CHASE2 domain-containing protein n=1 Tax=Nitrosomonas sp. PY1 TaxID=1803906 RepID=UPI001FC7E068|nr:adenylate/guanylate cyclase domain-containing protein [Nitrosomonas sp. PY1]